MEHLVEMLRDLGDGLNIVVVRPHPAAAMPKIDIGHDELAVILEDSPYFLEFLVLLGTHVFEKPEGDDKIKALIVKSNGLPRNIDFSQVRSWLMNGDIDAKIADVGTKQSLKSRWPAADVQEGAFSTPSHLID
jgi:hypothetical protein